jgi:hypothetical protein
MRGGQVMPKVSITHASADRYFVDLLAELLRYHHIDVGVDTNSLPAGDDFKGEPNKGLAESDTLIVVVSKNSCGSEQITQEIMSFQASKGKTNIIPVLLDDTHPDKVFDGLWDIQGILFYMNMLNGFQSLLKILGKEFLPEPARRSGSDRRQGGRRITDRRSSPVIQRLRNGLWQLYERETGCGKFEAAYLTLGERLKAIDVLQNELKKYACFSKDGNRCKPSKMELDKITCDVWQELGEREYLTAVIVMEAVAEKTLKQYELKPVDRREDDRRGDADRRDN